jgi:putative membrane protein
MMWGDGFGMGGWLLGGLMMLLFWAIWAFTRRQTGYASYSNKPQAPARSAPQGDPTLQIAKERYARGEISREQYDEIRQTLGV